MFLSTLFLKEKKVYKYIHTAINLQVCFIRHVFHISLSLQTAAFILHSLYNSLTHISDIVGIYPVFKK